MAKFWPEAGFGVKKLKLQQWVCPCFPFSISGWVCDSFVLVREGQETFF